MIGQYRIENGAEMMIDYWTGQGAHRGYTICRRTSSRDGEKWQDWVAMKDGEAWFEAATADAVKKEIDEALAEAQ